MTWNLAAQVHLDARLPIAPRWCVWITAVPVAGGAAQGAGFWTGDDHQVLTVEGAARLYWGAQGAMEIGPVAWEPGTGIGTQDITLGLSPEGEARARGWRLAGAAVDLHCALFDPVSAALLDVRRYFRGFVDEAPIDTPAQGQSAVLPLRCVSTARAGTMTTAGRKSDASQRLRLTSDAFRAYGDLGEATSDPWGGR